MVIIKKLFKFKVVAKDEPYADVGEHFIVADTVSEAWHKFLELEDAYNDEEDRVSIEFVDYVNY